MNLSGSRAHCEAEDLMRRECADSIRARGIRHTQTKAGYMEAIFLLSRTNFLLQYGADHIRPLRPQSHFSLLEKPCCQVAGLLFFCQGRESVCCEVLVTVQAGGVHFGKVKIYLGRVFISCRFFELAAQGMKPLVLFDEGMR